MKKKITKTVIFIGENSKKFFDSVKSDIGKVFLPFNDYNVEFDGEDNNPDIWIYFEIFDQVKTILSKFPKKNNKIIIVTQGHSYVIQGFIYNIAKYLKRKHKKVKIILNGNKLSKSFTSELKKYSKIKDIYNSKEYQTFLKRNFPHVSILELDGLLNSLYLKELKNF